MFDIILSCIGVFVLICIVIYALIWAVLGIRAYLSWYRDEHSELFLYELTVKRKYGEYEYRYFANSQKMALRKFQAEYDLDKDTPITVRLVK